MSAEGPSREACEAVAQATWVYPAELIPGGPPRFTVENKIAAARLTDALWRAAESQGLPRDALGLVGPTTAVIAAQIVLAAQPRQRVITRTRAFGWPAEDG